MAYVFIGGIPASGKSYLASEIARETGAYHLNTDDLRAEMSKDPGLEKWVNFYWNLDEAEYYSTSTCDQQWSNLTGQSEAFWPKILEAIEKVQAEHPSAIFEGVNFMPHLTSRDLDFPGIFLLGESVDQIFTRNKENPRWGATEELQRVEAENFFNCEGKMYKQEAEKYGYKTFRNFEEAKAEILTLLEQEQSHIE